MHNVSTPGPWRAARLRRRYQHSVRVQLATTNVRLLRPVSAGDAARLLPTWRHYKLLTRTEARAVVAQFVPERVR